MSTPEGRVKKEVKKILAKYDIYYYMPVPHGFGRRGVGDFICCVAGYFLAIETKKDKEELTELQEEDMKWVQRSKGIKLKIGPNDLSKLELVIRQLIEYRHQLES